MLHSLRIRVPDGDMSRATVELDGKALTGVTRVEFEIDGSTRVGGAIVRLEMYADVDVSLDEMVVVYQSDGPREDKAS